MHSMYLSWFRERLAICVKRYGPMKKKKHNKPIPYYSFKTVATRLEALKALFSVPMQRTCEIQHEKVDLLGVLIPLTVMLAIRLQSAFWLVDRLIL